MKKLALLLCFIGSAHATTQGLNVSGTVSSTCSFGSVTNGVFGYEVQTPHVLDTASAGGTNASVTIYYNGTPTVTFPEITSFSAVPSGFNDTVTFNNILSSSNAGGINYSSGSASVTESGSTSTDTFTLRLRAQDGQGSFPVGNYSAGTTITCQ